MATTAKERIRERLDELGWSYARLAREIGITTQAISEIINGRTTGATARYSVARALGGWPEDFWENEEELAGVSGGGRP